MRLIREQKDKRKNQEADRTEVRGLLIILVTLQITFLTLDELKGLVDARIHK